MEASSIRLYWQHPGIDLVNLSTKSLDCQHFAPLTDFRAAAGKFRFDAISGDPPYFDSADCHHGQ
ncbi:hypothetical protein Enr10x_29270 [Gimesia panareensis]|uniref:Uncharacterized protein n=1 Tax=Gimesia panareensis TaxID=2527978 RepID=A0A517Q7J8_9PLAN|nr:hypothetical protein Enr10x_29270 [Gimesia panareensis]